jgi:prepilin-type N-terminal cleavage/methylation domain-containing protein
MKAAPASEQGFTLFEILVGLAISSLIMLGLSSAMRTMDMGWRRATEMGERQAMITTGLAVFGGDLARVQRIYDNPARPERFRFVGDKSEIIFPMIERDGHNEEGLYWIRYFLRKEGPDIELVRARGTYDAASLDLPSVVWRDTVVLLRGPFRMEFSYLPPVTGSWDDNWPMQNRLPRQVRLDIETVRGRTLDVPPYVVALEQAAEIACANPESQFCTIKTGGTFTPKPANQAKPQ